MKCKACNEEFIPKRSDSIYCSSACKQKAFRAKNISNVTDNQNIGNVTTDEEVMLRLEVDRIMANCKEKGLDPIDLLVQLKLQTLIEFLSKVKPAYRNDFMVGLLDWWAETTAS
jgi:hypothetical protein